ncbi:integrase domain-containing protein [Microbulbifer sp. HZ11]|uniref:integrase domain-containing protein n=1 Tax=Microbulbifer sp. HZ11 TaxID=1453501 RepID=UPI0005BDEBDB|nr:integrase domain-containing protein [Microbulbifer sp. HZ11]
MSTGKNYGWGQSPVKAVKWALNQRARKGEIGDRTIQCYIQAFKKFAKYMREEHRIHDAVLYTEQHLSQFAESIVPTYAPAYLQKQTSAINSVMRTITYGKWDSISPSKTTQSRRRTARLDPHLYIAPEVIIAELEGSLQTQVHAAIGLVVHFGLRLEEAVSLDIVAALKEHAETGNIDIVYGTKGGRGRECRRLISANDSAYSWLCHCRKFTGPMFSLIPTGMKRDTFKKLVENEALPILKEKYGLTIHKLRHEYAARRYREITGHYTPVNCRAFGYPLAHRNLDQLARETITHELGHGRVQVVSIYIGSYRGHSNEQKD